MVYSAKSDVAGTISQFTRRKNITINTNGTSTPAAYQIKLTIAYEPAMQSTFADIRFNTMGNVYIDYWIESFTASTTATVWLELPDAITDPGSDSIWMYYGNAAVSDGGSGNNTFLFFDDFNRADGAIGNNWAQDNGYVTISSNRMLIADSGVDGRGSHAATGAVNNVVLQGDMMLITATEKYMGAFVRAPLGGTYMSGTGWITINNANVHLYDNGGSLGSVAKVLTLDTWYNMELRIAADNAMELRLWLKTEARPDAALITKAAFSPAATGTRLGLTGAGNLNVNHAYVNHIFYRAFVPIEPTATLGTAQHQRRVPRFL